MDADTRARLEHLVQKAFDAKATIIASQDIAPGLGTRRFYRLKLSGDCGAQSVVARVEAPEDPQRRPTGAASEPPLEPLRSFLEESGLPVPEVHARDAENGIDLLEDLGDESLELRAEKAETSERIALYAEACDWLPKLQALQADPETIPAFGRRLDQSLIAYKAERFVRFALPFALAREPRESEAAIVREAFLAIAESAASAPQRLAHRDYKAANLYLRPAAPPGRRLVWIDIQGAFLAPPEYDLVCLLRDSHVALPEAEVQEQLMRVRPSLPDAPDAKSFLHRIALLTLARVGKDLALYLYADQQLGDPRYRRFVPTALRNWKAALRKLAADDSRFTRLGDLAADFQNREPACGQ